MKTVFLRALEVDDEAAIHTSGAPRGRQHFEVDPAGFAVVPGSPFCYRVGDRLRSVFSTLPPIERGQRAARAGGQTSDDARYLRSYWELGTSSMPRKWHTYLKGGKATKSYVDQVLVAPWDTRRATFPGFLGRPGGASEKPSNYELYFRPGLTWRLRASAFSPQVMPAGCIFTVRSYAIIDDKQNLLAEHVRTINAEQVAIHAEIDARCFDLYGIDEGDRRLIAECFGSDSNAWDEQADDDVEADEEDHEVNPDSSINATDWV